jgi:predicted peroxiredoxin
MNEQAKKLVVVLNCGMEDERSSVAWSFANGGLNSGLDVTMFLTSSGVDWVRKGAADKAHINPFDPSMKEMIDNFRSKGGHVLACPPCLKVRNYTQDDLLDGVTIVGSTAVHELIKTGAEVISF